MKIRNIASLAIGLLLLLVTACEPIEDRKSLENSFDPDNIALEVIQTADGVGNGLSIRMNTPGVTGYWDYKLDKKYTDRVEVNFPIPGLHTFTYYVTTAYMPNGDPTDVEYVSKSIDVQIDVLDQPLPEQYYMLVGENLEGKTWVFDGGPEPDGRLWYFMSENDKPEGHMSPWWNAAGDCCPPPDAAGRMVFDLDGGANYTYYSGPDAEPEKGRFAFNGDFTKLTIGDGAGILGYYAQDGNQNGTDNGVYSMMLLSDDKLVLYNPQSAGYGTGWTWVFKPAE